jgi:hypothetical protein
MKLDHRQVRLSPTGLKWREPSIDVVRKHFVPMRRRRVGWCCYDEKLIVSTDECAKIGDQVRRDRSIER